MSFTTRILLGNAVVVFITVTVMSILSPPNHLLINLGAGVLMLFGSSIVLGWLSGRAFTPLTTVTTALEKAAAGDLSVRVPTGGFGEIARLGAAFNTMMNDMNKAMRQFFSVADIVRDSVGMVSSTTQSAVRMVSSSCSTTISVFPRSRRRVSVAMSFALSRWWRPMDGSSRM